MLKSNMQTYLLGPSRAWPLSCLEKGATIGRTHHRHTYTFEAGSLFIFDAVYVFLHTCTPRPADTAAGAIPQTCPRLSLPGADSIFVNNMEKTPEGSLRALAYELPHQRGHLLYRTCGLASSGPELPAEVLS